MQETSTSPATILQFRQDIEAQLRRQIREALLEVLVDSMPILFERRAIEREAKCHAFVTLRFPPCAKFRIIHAYDFLARCIELVCPAFSTAGPLCYS